MSAETPMFDDFNIMHLLSVDELGHNVYDRLIYSGDTPEDFAEVTTISGCGLVFDASVAAVSGIHHATAQTVIFEFKKPEILH